MKGKKRKNCPDCEDKNGLLLWQGIIAIAKKLGADVVKCPRCGRILWKRNKAP